MASAELWVVAMESSSENSWLLVDDEPLHQIANGVPAQGI
jgi:hypothetical protein